MTLDCDLLRRYAESDSEDAFAELVRRHLDLVYSAALRQVNGDAHLAQDVAQTVFTDLARKAAVLSRRQVLAGWLYTSTHFAAAKAVRRERRRHAREQEARAINELLQAPAPDSDWESLHPALDTVMHELPASDRDAILMRYFENRPLANIGEALGVSEDAARKRVDRALEKLRALFSKHGIGATAALGAALSSHAVQSAPAGLAATLTGTSLAGAAAGTGITLTLLNFMAMTKVQFSLTALALIGTATTLVVHHQTQSRLRQENQWLRQQILRLESGNATLSHRLAQAKGERLPRLPAPPVHLTTPPAAPPESSPSTNLFGRLKGLKDKAPNRLNREQVEPYLNANGRNAASLLAAYRATGDPALFAEAARQFPNHPQVALEAVLKKDASPEERARWLEAFKQGDPENAFPNYLAALDHLRAGRTDQAVQELVAAAGQPQFQDYAAPRAHEDEAAYLAAGYSPAEAKAMGPLQAAIMLIDSDDEAEAFAPLRSRVPQLQQVKALCVSLKDLAQAYGQAGDPASAQAALEMAVNLGQRYSNTPGADGVSQLTGSAVELIALNAMNSATPYGNSGQTVQDRISQLNQQRKAMRGLYEQAFPLLGAISDEDWTSYAERVRFFGEPATLQWVTGKYGPK